MVKTCLVRPLIEGLARLVMVQLYARQAGSFRFVMTTCRALCEINFEPDHKELELLPYEVILYLENLHMCKLFLNRPLFLTKTRENLTL